MNTVSLDTNVILTTKMYPPRVTPDKVPRTQLMERLERHAQRPLTLISAPAGYGKSVLASMWLQNSGRPYGWVSLDEHDNDLPTFLAYMLAAINSVVPEAPLQQAQSLLELSTLPPANIVARYLLNDLTRIEESFYLALDDFHVIREPVIFDLIATLLQHPSPNFHLVLIGRHDPPLPISSLRAYRQVTEIRMGDLRFSSTETARFLNRILERPFSDSAVLEWTQKTEGWVVALRLAALSLSRRRKTTDWPGTVSGENQYLQDYLLAEILAHLPKAFQASLLKTAVLDRFCAPLCEAICDEVGGTTNSDDLCGEEFIEWLRESNLFLIALDDNNEWFRFHHLFQSHLRNMLERQLNPQEIAAIHLRAANWFSDNGYAFEAIEHALTAGANAVAIDCLIQSRYQYMNNEQWNVLDRLLKLFPDDLIRSDPFLSITKAFTVFFRSRLHGTATYLAAAEQAVAELPADSPFRAVVAAEIATLTAVVAITNEQKATAFSEELRSAWDISSTNALFVRGLAIGTEVAGYQVAGNWQQGLLVGRKAMSNPKTPPGVRSFILSDLCAAAYMEGALDIIILSASQSLQLSKQNQHWQEKGWTRYFLAIAHYLRNDLAIAEKHLSRIVESPRTVPAYVAFTVCALARLYQSQGRLDEAAKILQTTHTHLENIGAMGLLETIKAFEVEQALDENKLPAAEQLSQAVEIDLRPMIWFHYVPQLTPIKLLLRKGGQKNLEQAQNQLSTMEDHLRSINRKTILIDVLALQALVYYAQGNTQTAREKLHESLLLAEPGGFIRNYVDLGDTMAGLLRFYQHHQPETGAISPYVARILAAFPQAKPASAASDKSNAPPQLTKREMEILQLLATDLSPKEIADEKFIAVATARRHIRNVYGKLGVHGRFEAVHIAQETGLL